MSFCLWDSILSLYNGKTITWLSVGHRKPVPGKVGNLCHLRRQCCCWSWGERYAYSAQPDPRLEPEARAEASGPLWAVQAGRSLGEGRPPGLAAVGLLADGPLSGPPPGSALWICTLTLPSPAALRLWLLMTLTWPTDVAGSLTEPWTRPWPTSYHSPPHLTTPQETNHPSYMLGTSQYAKPDSGAYSTQDWARLMTEQPFNIITCIHTNFCKYWHTKKRKDHCTE